MKQPFSVKTLVRNSVLGVIALLALVWVSIPNQAQAIELCSALGTPTMQITLPGYGTYANSAGNPDANYSISVPAGTSLTGTYSNFSGAADNYTIFDSWPGGGSQTYHSNPGSRTHSSGAMNTQTSFGITLDPNCTEDPSPAEGGSVTVTVNISTPAPTATLTASPNPVNSGSATTLTWTSTNATSCTATGGSGFSTGSATSGSDASSNLTTQTTFSMTCTGAGGTVSKSVTVSVNAAPTAPTCFVNPLSAATGATVRATASGGTSGSYTWSTGGGSACAAGTTCDTSYTTTGSKTITVTRNGLSGTCPVTITNTAVNGMCGSAENGTFATAPTTNLCSQGGSTSVAGGVTSWTWSCVGVNGGTTASCDAAVTASPVTCSGPSAGQTGVSYTFTGGGASSLTWTVAPATGIAPAGASGSGTSVTKSFSSVGTKTITFASGSNSAQCTIDITTTPPSLYFDLSASPTIVSVGQTATLSWTSAAADRVDNLGSSPADEAWVSGSEIADAGSVTVSPLVRTTYSGRGVKYSPVGQASDTAVIQVRPQCLPAGQTVEVGEPATLTAAGGNGTYAWTATGGSTASGTGSSLSTSYTTEGTKTVSLVSDSLTTTCTVTVAPPASTGTVVVNSVNAQGEPFLSTWTLSGPGEPQTPGSPTASVTYTDQPAGLYNLTAASVEGYTSAIGPGGGQNLEAGETITYTITYTDVPINEEAWVDLRANPTSVDSGQASTLSWTSYGIESRTCVATGDWTGSKDDEGSESTGALTEGTTYTITCDAMQVSKGDPATVSDTVTVLIGAGDDDDDGTPDCSDGVNNDAGDNLVDYDGEDGIDGNSDDDPGCYGPEDPSEEDVPQPGDDDDDVIIGACGDGFDNDGDGTIDENDTGCDSGDGTEQSEPDIREI